MEPPIFKKSTRFEDMKNFEHKRVFRSPSVSKVMSKAGAMASRDDDLDLAEFSPGAKSGQSSLGNMPRGLKQCQWILWCVLNQRWIQMKFELELNKWFRISVGQR